MERLDDEAFVEGMRFDHIIQIARMHMEAMRELAPASAESTDTGWTEEDDEDFINRILPEIEAEDGFDEGSREDEGLTESSDND